VEELTWMASYLELNIAATLCDAVEIYPSSVRLTPASQIDVDVYYGGVWHSLYQGTFTTDAWNVFHFRDSLIATPQTITAMRVRFYNGHATLNDKFAIYEAKFHKRYSNLALTSGLVSDVVARRLWFDVSGDVFYIPLPKYNLLPKKNASFVYAASGVHITPWYSFDSFVQTKYLDILSIFGSDLTAAETVTVKYRLDHAGNDLDTGWTTLAVLNADDNNATTWPFGASAGVTASAIQFRFDLARGGTATLAPDLKAYGISYQRQLNKKYSYQVKITARDQRYTPREIGAALNAAVANRTKMPFYYRNTAKYVQVYDFTVSEPAGDNYDGVYTLLLIEV
jgi:hypothetical protein